ncbi:unnamed protein product, partial [Effrenium voratum]
APGETGCEATGAGQRFPATWSVRSSEAATLLEETPRLDRDEALAQGESGDVTPGFVGCPRARTLGHEPRLPPCSWWTRGPPVAAVSAAGNSWLYVPLLHAAAGTLERSAFEAWARQTTWDGWLPMVHLLQEAAPADVGIIRLVLEGQGAATSRYAVSLPLPAVAAFLVEPDGYFIASVQETLLEIFAGPEPARACGAAAKLREHFPPGDGSSPAGRRRGARGGARHHVELRCSVVFVPSMTLDARPACFCAPKRPPVGPGRAGARQREKLWDGSVPHDQAADSTVRLAQRHHAAQAKRGGDDFGDVRQRKPLRGVVEQLHGPHLGERGANWLVRLVLENSFRDWRSRALRSASGIPEFAQRLLVAWCQRLRHQCTGRSREFSYVRNAAARSPLASSQSGGAGSGPSRGPRRLQ